MKRRDPLAVAAVALAVVAFAGSFDHVRSVVDAHGQHGWLAVAIAAMPEVSVALAVLKVRRSRVTGEATGWAWLVGASAAGFTVSANLATAEHSPWGYVVAAWPAWASIGAAGLIEMKGSPDPTPAGSAHFPPVVDGAQSAPEPTEGDPTEDVVDDDVPPAGLALVPTPAPRPAPVASARSAKPRTPRPRTSTPDRRRTLDELLTELRAAVEVGDLPAEPSAGEIMRHLRVGADRGRRLRDLLSADTPDRSGDGDPTEGTDESGDALPTEATA